MTTWHDHLAAPTSEATSQLLLHFWQQLETLADLLPRSEYLLGEAIVSELRHTVMQMMLAANGIAYPVGTLHLNDYLGDSQRVALERTLAARGLPRAAIIGRAVALATIYGWYAPQLATPEQLAQISQLEMRVWQTLVDALHEWPLQLASD